MIKNLKLESPYILVESGKWTLDKFIEMAKAARKQDKNQYGVTGTSFDVWSYIVGTGLQTIKNDSSSKKVVFNFKATKTTQVNNQAVSTINKLKDICIYGETRAPWVQSQEWTATIKTFTDGRALFWCGIPRTATLEANTWLREMKDDWGMVPMPNLGGTTYRDLVDINAATWIVPVTNKKNLDKTGIILEALAYHSFYDYNPLFAKDYADTYFRDQESRDMLSTIYQSTSYDLLNVAGTNDPRIWAIQNEIMYVGATNRNSDPAQLITKYEDSIRKGIDELFNAEQ